MERLTFEGDFCDIAMCTEVRGGSYCEDGCCSQRKVWERLKQYEDAEAEGRLVVLPCKVGDTVWIVNALGCGLVEEYKIYRISLYMEYGTEVPFYSAGLLSAKYCDYCKFEVSEFGKTVFLTEEEAKAALKFGCKL